MKDKLHRGPTKEIHKELNKKGNLSIQGNLIK